MHVIASGTARQAHTESCRRRIEEELKGTAMAHVATRRMKEYQDRAAEKGTKRTKADQEEGRQQREHGESTARMEEDAPTSSSSGSGDVTPTQSPSSSGSTTKMSGHEGRGECKEITQKRKAEEEHPEDPERHDGKWMRTDGSKRKAGEESEESRLRKTVRYLKELDKMENKKVSGKVQEVVEVAEVEVNEEVEEWMAAEEPRRGDEGGALDPEQVRHGREEEMNYMIEPLKMFVFGSWEDATSRTSKMPTTTKRVDRAGLLRVLNERQHLRTSSLKRRWLAQAAAPSTPKWLSLSKYKIAHFRTDFWALFQQSLTVQTPSPPWQT